MSGPATTRAVTFATALRRFGSRAIAAAAVVGGAGGAAMSARPEPAAAQDDNPRLRWEHFYRQRAYPFGTIPPGALQRAREQLIGTWPDPFGDAFLRAAVPWTQIGPERIPISLTSSGRLSTIAVHPSDPNTLYIGAAQGGVWKTVNGGASWTPLTDRECSLAMGSIAIDPVDPNIVYAGTGEQHFSGDSYYGCGVLRSADGGTTWTTLGISVFQTAAEGARISKIVIDPATAGSTTGTTVLVASDFGLFRSTNSGTDWTTVLTGTTTDVVMDPTNSATLYAGRWGVGLSKSTDGGVNWVALTSGLPVADVGRINLAIAPSAPQTIYAAVHTTSGNGLAGIFKTTDGGADWTQLTATNANCGAQCWYDMTIAVHPTNDSLVYFGGITLFRSSDGGANFASINGPLHVDQHFLTFDPLDPNTVYVANDGGIYKSTDGGSTWTTLNTNLSITQFYPGISLHPNDPSVAMGGTQDNGTVGYTGTADWASLLSGDGGFTAIDFLNPTTRYAETQWTASSGFSGPRRSDAGFFVHKVNGIDTDDRALFIPPLIMDPVDPQVLYFGTFRLYRTADRADSWTAISPDLTTGGSISAIAVSPADSDVLYVGSNTGDLHTTVDGGASWTTVDAALPDRYVTDIAIDESDPQTAFVTVSGFGSGHVFKTTDGGAGWQDVSANLPDVPMNAVLIEPGTPSNIFLGTDLGVFMSTDGAASWAPFNDGLPLVAVFDLALMPNTGVFLAATHGRGMFSRTVVIALSMTVTPQSRVDTLVEGSTTLVADSAWVTLTGPGSTIQQWTASHGGGAWLTVTSPGGTGRGYVTWTRNASGLARGTYVDTITVDATGSGLAPARVIDSLVIAEALTVAVSPTSRIDTMVAGMTVPVTDSAVVDLRGLGGEAATWTATHGAAGWLTIASPVGTGSGVLRWTRSAARLNPGIFVDTITVASEGAAGSPVTLVDTLVVAAPIALEAAARQLFFGGAGGGELSQLQIAFLRSLGNDDDVYDLGDVLAWVDHCESPTPGGCVVSAAAAQRIEDPPGGRAR